MNYSDKVSSFTVACSNAYLLWNFQFGKFQFPCLRLLYQKQMVIGFHPMREATSTCECFILGKKHREISPKGVAYRENQPLELVHANLCEPMRTQSIVGSCYFLNFIYDYLRKSWVYFLN